jgi:hypothetical protein
MRRVYTIYTARVVSHPLLLNLAIFAVALTIFRELVFVKRVMETLSNMPISAFPEFVLTTVMRGEVMTLAALGIMIFTAFSIQWQIRSVALPKMTHPTASAQ